MSLKPTVLYLTKMGIVFAGYAIFISILEMSLHYQETGKYEFFFINNAYILGLMSPVAAFFASRHLGYIARQSNMGGGTINLKIYKIKLHPTIKYVVSLFTCTILFLLTNLVASLGKAKFAVLPVEFYLFYVAIGIAEEFYYRALIVTAAIIAFKARNKILSFSMLAGVIISCILNSFISDTGIRLAMLVIGSSFFAVEASLERSITSQKSILGSITGIALSALLFSLAHYQVYAVSNPELLIANAIIGGLTGFFFVWTQDITVPATAHAVNNFFAAPHIR
jgi:membrane protease YdiL (CAAX protease family)